MAHIYNILGLHTLGSHLRPGDTVSFYDTGHPFPVEHKYQVRNSFLEHPSQDNTRIWEVIKLEKKRQYVAASLYGMKETANGGWPTYRDMGQAYKGIEFIYKCLALMSNRPLLYNEAVRHYTEGRATTEQFIKDIEDLYVQHYHLLSTPDELTTTNTYTDDSDNTINVPPKIASIAGASPLEQTAIQGTAGPTSIAEQHLDNEGASGRPGAKA